MYSFDVFILLIWVNTVRPYTPLATVHMGVVRIPLKIKAAIVLVL